MADFKERVLKTLEKHHCELRLEGARNEPDFYFNPKTGCGSFVDKKVMSPIEELRIYKNLRITNPY